METGVARLRIDLVGDHLVSISREANVSDAVWDQVYMWWTDGASTSITANRIEINIAEFIYKMAWLRHGWKSLGNELEISDEVKFAVARTRDEQQIFERLTAALDNAEFVDLSPLALRRVLTECQIKNVMALLRMKNGANFSVPGAGKTSTALVVWEFLRMKGEVSKLLVICPRSAFEAWLTEPRETFNRDVNGAVFNDLGIATDTEILIVNYEQLENSSRLERIERWVQTNRAMVVVDEAHRIKSGASSVRWMACRRIGTVATRIDLLTGTPMPQAYEDLRNLLTLSWQQISRAYFSDARLQGLKRGGVFVRTTKVELALPPVKIKEVEFEAGVIQKNVYLALCRAYAGTFGLNSHDASFMGRKGRAVMTLLAVATNPGLLSGLVTDDSYLNLRWPPQELESSVRLLDAVQSYAAHEMPAKYDWVRRFVEVAAQENRKVIVWSTFNGNLRALQRVLGPHKPALINGSTSPEARISELDRFRRSSDCTVLLTNPQTLGEGISLHHNCHDAIYVDRSYNAGLYLQSLDRIHRLGLDKEQETRIFILTTKQTIDQQVGRRLELKIDRLARAMDDVGLVATSLPGQDNDFEIEELVGFDLLDADDLYAHLKLYE